MNKNCAKRSKNAPSVFKYLLFVAFLATGCAHYKYETAGARYQIFSAHPEQAIPKLKEKAEQPGKDQLLYLLDLGIAYHVAGQYQEAVSTFLKAETIAEIKDYTSITEETGTLLVTDNVKGYTGEDFEKVLINIYLALDYSLLGKHEDALVECRKVNQLLYRFINEGKRPYNQNPLAYYLSGIMYEMDRNINDAYIDYKNVRKHAPEFTMVGADLLGLARKLGFTDQAEQWRSQYGDSPTSKAASTGRKDLTEKGYGDLIVLLELGKAPEKVPSRQMESLPEFRDIPYRAHSATVRVNGELKAETTTIFSVRDVAFTNLNNRIGKMMAKKVLGMGAKAAVGYGIAKATKSDDLGILAGLLLMAADQADLRSWLTLPAKFEIARIALPAGKQHVAIEIHDAAGGLVGTRVLDVDIPARGHVLISQREAQ